MTHSAQKSGFIIAILIALPMSADAAATDSRVQPGTCPARLPAIEVRVTGVKKASGKIRVQAYSSQGFLKKGQWLARAEVMVKSRSLTVCLTLREPGRYAIAVRHDVNDNEKADWNDGAGFSGNPRVSLLSQPRFDQTSIPLNAGLNKTTVIMNYRRGWSVGPLSH